jgi:large subunit ribosomal protein L15
MKLHDLRPAPGSRVERTRVGRGIAAGKGKTAGRGTKGQKARAGGNIPPGFEGGQTPLHQRIPKLRGFRNRGKVEYEVVNVGRIVEVVAAGRIPAEPASGRSKKAAPTTVNQEVLRAAGLVRTLARPLKVLGEGDVDRALFVVADAFTRSARQKIEAAGGTAQLLEVPSTPLEALTGEPASTTTEPAAPAEAASRVEVAEPSEAVEAETPLETAAEAATEPESDTTAEATAEDPAEAASEADIDAPADGSGT